MSELYAIASPFRYRSEPALEDKKYLTFIRRLPCIACGKARHIEAAHFGPRGLGQKASDRNALPLCSRCHRIGLLSYHQLGPVRFALAHQLKPEKWIERLNRDYDVQEQNLKHQHPRRRPEPRETNGSVQCG